MCTRTCLRQHGRQQLAHDGAPLPHLALLAVGEVRDDPDNVPGTGGLQCVRHDQKLHHSCVHISETVKIGILGSGPFFNP